eukprot:78322_1
MTNLTAMLFSIMLSLKIIDGNNEYHVVNGNWNITTIANELNEDKSYSAIISVNNKANTFSNYVALFNEYLNSSSHYYIIFQPKEDHDIHILLSLMKNNFAFENVFITKHVSQTISILTDNCLQNKLVRLYAGYKFKTECVEEWNKDNTYHKSTRKLLIFYDKWETTNAILPRGGDANMAAGYYNDSIFLLGGDSHGYQLLEYNFLKKTLIDYGKLALIPTESLGFGQYYSQIDDTLYIISYPNGDKLSVFNMSTKVFESVWNNVDIPLAVSSAGCLASSTIFTEKYINYLFIVGGGGNGVYLNTLQTLDITAMIWYSSTMKDFRAYLSCIVHPQSNELYAIGGYNGTNYLNTVEKIYYPGIHTQQWEYISNLLFPVIHSRSVIFKNKILVIGGDNDGDYVNEIQLIDITTGKTSSGGFTEYAMESTSAINVKDIIYAFGGAVEFNRYLDIMQYVDLTPTNEPTVDPTSEPTHNPTSLTINPSLAPTQSPTNAPSNKPTNYPTLTPTHPPSITPTLSPTEPPSLAPSVSPTNVPSISPTNNPSLSPTKAPSFAPTWSPTNPTQKPTQAPSQSPTHNPTNFPTQFPTQFPTYSPTNTPTTAPTYSPTAVIVCNFTLIATTDCVFENLDSSHCCSYIQARNIWTSYENQYDSLTDQEILNVVTRIRDIQMYMFIFDTTLAFIVIAITTIFWLKKNPIQEAIVTYDVALSAFGAMFDVILTCASIIIIADNNLINELGDLYKYNCYTKTASADVIELQGSFSQILTLDSLEAVLDIIGLITLLLGIGKCKDNQLLKFIAMAVHGALFGLDWILTVVNFVVFVLPSYQKFQDIYRNNDLLCYQAIYNTSPFVDEMNSVSKVILGGYIGFGVILSITIITIIIIVKIKSKQFNEFIQDKKIRDDILGKKN